jgi:hypothetical protein
MIAAHSNKQARNLCIYETLIIQLNLWVVFSKSESFYIDFPCGNNRSAE